MATPDLVSAKEPSFRAPTVPSAFGGWKRRVNTAKSGGPPVSYEKLIDDYLNETHRDNPGTGCVFNAAGAGDRPYR